jgi:hypothetical protein
MRNWKTSLFGTMTSIFTGLAVLDLPFKEYFAAGAVISGALFALFSKDKDKKPKAKSKDGAVLPDKGL